MEILSCLMRQFCPKWCASGEGLSHIAYYLPDVTAVSVKNGYTSNMRCSYLVGKMLRKGN